MKTLDRSHLVGIMGVGRTMEVDFLVGAVAEGSLEGEGGILGVVAIEHGSWGGWKDRLAGED